MEKYIAGRGEEDNCTSAVSHQHQVENFISSSFPRALAQDVREPQMNLEYYQFFQNGDQMQNLKFLISHRTPRHLALSTLHVRLEDEEEESCEYLQLVRSAQTCVLTVISGARAPSNLCRSAIIGVSLPICRNSCSKC